MFDKRKDNNPASGSVGRNPRPSEPSREPASGKTSPSMIGRSVAIEGTLNAQEDILLEGRFSGEVVLLDNALVVGQTGDIRADIKAKNITIHGKANGDIQATDQVEISATGTMRGDILSPRVILHDGAKFKGRIDMEPEGIGEQPGKVTASPSKPAPPPAKPSESAANAAKPAAARARV